MGETLRSCVRSYILWGSLVWLAPTPAPAAKPDAEEFTVPLQATTAATSPLRRAVSRARAGKDALTGETALYAPTAPNAIAEWWASIPLAAG